MPELVYDVATGPSARDRDHLWYLASPYSHPDESTRRRRAELAARCAGLLAARGWLVYSPIAHGQAMLDQVRNLGLWSHEQWLDYDLPMLRRCDGILVLQLTGWRESRGILAELEAADKAWKTARAVIMSSLSDPPMVSQEVTPMELAMGAEVTA